MVKKISANEIFQGVVLPQLPFSAILLLTLAFAPFQLSADSRMDFEDIGMITASGMPENSREFLPVRSVVFSVAAVHCARVNETIGDTLSESEIISRSYLICSRYIPVQDFTLRINSSSISGRAGPLS